MVQGNKKSKNFSFRTKEMEMDVGKRDEK